MSSFLDTNILVYAFGDEDHRRERAQSLIYGGNVTVSVQVLNEFASVARRKLRRSWTEIDEVLDLALQFCGPVVPSTLEIHRSATALCRRHQFHIYDSMIVAAALNAGCGTLYSEDMHAGLVVEDRLTIVNPFA